MKKTIAIILMVFMAAALFAACSQPAAPAEDTSTAAEQPAAEVPSETVPPTEDDAATAADDDTTASQPADEAAATESSWADIQEKGYFVMGLDDGFPPMGFRDENGEIVGFDVDLAKAVAEKMGVDVQLQKIDWSTKELELDAGSIDVIWNGYTITPERQEKVLMSEPYMQNMQVMLVPADSEIQTLDDLADKKVAVQEGSSAQSLITEDLGDDQALLNSFGEFLGYKDYVTALLDIDSGQMDALAVDLVVADYYMSQKPGQYRILDETLAPEDYGIGFRKGDQSFYDALMGAFEELKTDGTAAEISNEWFGRDVTAAQ